MNYLKLWQLTLDYVFFTESFKGGFIHKHPHFFNCVGNWSEAIHTWKNWFPVYLKTVKQNMKMEVMMRRESHPTRPMRSVLMELFICGRLKTTIETTLPKSPRTPTLLMRMPWTTNSKVTSNDQLSTTSLGPVVSCIDVKFSIVTLFVYELTDTHYWTAERKRK